MFGGTDPPTCHGPAGCTVPSDITIANNTMRKPLYWKKNDPSWVAGTPNWCIGNLLELKNAQRVLIDHNDMQYSWWTGCDGNLSNFSIALTVRNQDGSDPAAVVQDVTFTNNYIAHVPGGINFLGQDDGYTSQPETRSRAGGAPGVCRRMRKASTRLCSPFSGQTRAK